MVNRSGNQMISIQYLNFSPREFYDHSQDQAEYYNLADQPQYSQLRQRLAKLLKQGFPDLN